MRRFVYDRIFILTDGQEVPDNVIDEAVDKVNSDAEIPIKNRPSFIEVHRSKEGSFFTSGLIPARPNDERVARFGVAWFTDVKGNKHVRVTSDVKKIKIYESACLWPRHMPSTSLVYPGIQFLEDGTLWLRCSCGKGGILEDMGWNGNVCGVCRQKLQEEEEISLQKQQYERETGFQSGR